MQTEPRIDAVADVFATEDLVGTIVVESADGKTRHVHNQERANTRFSPASTFKIPNTLIALDAAIVTSASSQFTWDGTTRWVAAWNSNQTLESAFKVSCVWCYQEMARQIGRNTYISELAQIDYGNGIVGDHADQFWLNGDLQISASEQIEFLRKLYNYSIPYRREHVDIVKAIMLTEQSTDYDIYAKTGWAGPEPHVGWYVGYVEKNNETWLFAMNMRMDRADQASLRKELTIRSLQALGIQ